MSFKGAFSAAGKERLSVQWKRRMASPSHLPSAFPTPPPDGSPSMLDRFAERGPHLDGARALPWVCFTKGDHSLPKLKSSKRVTLSALVQRPTLPASWNVSSVHSRD